MPGTKLCFWVECLENWGDGRSRCITHDYQLLWASVAYDGLQQGLKVTISASECLQTIPDVWLYPVIGRADLHALYRST